MTGVTPIIDGPVSNVQLYGPVLELPLEHITTLAAVLASSGTWFCVEPRENARVGIRLKDDAEAEQSLRTLATLVSALILLAKVPND